MFAFYVQYKLYLLILPIGIPTFGFQRGRGVFSCILVLLRNAVSSPILHPVASCTGCFFLLCKEHLCYFSAETQHSINSLALHQEGFLHTLTTAKIDYPKVAICFLALMALLL